MKKYFSIFILSLILISCHAVSPSLQMPKENIKQGDFCIQPSLEIMPETDYQAFNSHFSGGETLFLRYGVTDYLTAQMKFWVPNHNYYSEFRWGFSIMPIIYVNPNDDTKFFAVPTLNLLQNDFDFNYASVGIFAGASFQKILGLYPYAALSIHRAFAWGSASDKGTGATANAGVNIPVWSWLDINLELTYTMLSHYRLFPGRVDNDFLSPSISFGINF